MERRKIMELAIIAAAVLIVAFTVGIKAGDICNEIKTLESSITQLRETIEKKQILKMEINGAEHIDNNTGITPEKKVNKNIERPCDYGEEWKPLVQPLPLPQLEQDIILDAYDISSFGRVWDRKRNKLMKARTNGSDDVKVHLRTQKGHTYRSVKVLVASAFIGRQSCYKYRVVNCDGNPKNNAASNLRWEEIVREGWKH